MNLLFAQLNNKIVKCKKCTRLVNFTANVIGSDLTVSNGSLIIENEHSGGSTVFNSLPTPPFFVTLNQLVDTRFFDNREMYIAGTSFTEIQSNVIGRMVMDSLKDLDKIAYIRFASVYTNFKEVGQFGEYIEELDGKS